MLIDFEEIMHTRYAAEESIRQEVLARTHRILQMEIDIATSDARVQTLTVQLEEARRSVSYADRLRAQILSRVKAAESRAEDAERRVEDAERRAEDAERRVEDAERRVEDAERRDEDAKRRVEDAERRAEDAERRGEDAKRRAEGAARELQRVAEERGTLISDLQSKLTQAVAFPSMSGHFFFTVAARATERTYPCC